jgi:isoleucyl-tRNA synthetase
MEFGNEGTSRDGISAKYNFAKCGRRSQVQLGNEEKITVARAEEKGAKKCVRCWRYYDKLGDDPGHPELCERCTGVVLNFGK